MNRRTVLTLALCGLVLLAGCQGASNLFGSSGEATTERPTVTPSVATTTPTPTPNQPSGETLTVTPRATASPEMRHSDGSFSEPAFRGAFREDIAQARETRGVEPLAIARDQRQVTNTIARELETVNYFENATAQNNSQFDVQSRVNRAGLSCAVTTASGQSVGGGYLLKGFYQTYVEDGENITYYETEEQLARSMTTSLLTPNSSAERQELSATIYAPNATTHSIGIYRTADDVIYVAYVIC